MLKIKFNIKSASFEKKLTSILSILSNFHSLEVLDRASETQLQEGENSNCIIWRFRVNQDYNRCKYVGRG